MTRRFRSCFFLYVGLMIAGLWGCERKESVPAISAIESVPPLFTLLGPEQTNVHFQNTLTEGLNTNVLTYEYLYNGGGVATGDFNGDGLIDIYFTSNMSDNRFYINEGGMKFRDVTEPAMVTGRAGPWKTGVTAVDINGDDRLDLYLCYSGAMPAEKRRNQLFINEGNDENNIPVFSEKAAEFGLDSPAFSNQGYFLDYDRDGDLDMLLLNHNPKSLPVLNETSTETLLKVDDPLQGVRLYRQDKGVFSDVTVKAGISGSALTYGLGIGISDLNNDGWLDFYVSNDYTIPDYLYINNRNGTFTDELAESLGHTSHFSMGNNIADINNDGLPDIYTLDMLPEDNHRQKLLLAPDNYEKFDLNLRSGFHHQYMRNMLQLNNGNGTFSEIGQLAGVSNTDWSWAALLADYDNDGWKDLFVTNGYFRDYTNLDFINYMETYVQSKGRLQREDVLQIINKMPASDLTNYLFMNIDGKRFRNATKTYGLENPANSNGAAYADLDNDGDLDLVVNNINQPAFIYRNEVQREGKNYLQLRLKGGDLNTQGIGAHVTLYDDNGRQDLEQVTSRGYLSSVSPILHFGLGDAKEIDSLLITWNTGKSQKLIAVPAGQLLVLDEKEAARLENRKDKPVSLLEEIPSPIKYVANRSAANDFKRQTLLLSQFSHMGPSMTKGDVNNDGLEDIFIGGGQDQAAHLYLQHKNRAFQKKDIPVFEQDRAGTDADAAVFDANGDGKEDIYVATGGYFNLDGKDSLLQDRLYLGDGLGGFSKSTPALPEMYTSNSCVAVNDINGDGSKDVFVGGRVVPGRYPEAPISRILLNDGKGHFTDQTRSIAPGITKLGMVTDARWVDLNGDNALDLIVVGEWMPVTVFLNVDGKLQEDTDTYFPGSYTGWWNTIGVEDLNGDDKPDFLLGNMGTNTQFRVTEKEPAEMYFADFDQNGSIDPLFCYYINGKSYPYLTRDELLGQLAGLRSRFTSYQSYADATLPEIFTAEQLKQAGHLTANRMETTLFLSTANGHYETASLPIEAQYAPVNEVAFADYNSDGMMDMILLGNNHHFKLRLGKFDANYGTLLLGDGKGGFQYVDQVSSGLAIEGEVKCSIQIGDVLFLGIYGEAVKAYKIKKTK